MDVRQSVRGWLTALALVSLVGCGSKPAEREAARISQSDSTNRSASFDEMPAALLRPPIGPRDSLIRVVAPSLRGWVVLWKAARADFATDSLRFAGWSDFHPLPDAEPWALPDSLDADEEGLNALVVEAPGGRRRILIDRYQEISGGGIGGEPDSAPVLFDGGTGRTYTFEFCGTMCGFHWAEWIDSTRFVLGGWGEADSKTQRSYGTLDYYDLQRGLSARYLVPVFSDDEYERYIAAWHEWVFARARRLGRRARA